MKTVLAAVDDRATARDVLQTALVIGELTGAAVEAVHVRVDGHVEPQDLAAELGVELRVLEGGAGDRLVEALADDDVVVGVLGARCFPGERRPPDGTTFHVLEHTTKPVVVVPPGCPAAPPRERRTPRRLLIPLEGERVSSQPVVEALDHLLTTQVEVVVLHVFTEATMPRMLDRPVRDLSMWGDEFVARFCSPASRIELRIGAVADHVARLAEAEHIDLVVMSWSRIRSAGHAKVVCEVLETSQTPILLLAVTAEAAASTADR